MPPFFGADASHPAARAKTRNIQMFLRYRKMAPRRFNTQIGDLVYS
jgi:hypothetical protein